MQLFYLSLSKGSGGGEVARATASLTRGREFKSTWRQGFFLFFFFNQWQSVFNQVPQERCIFAVFPMIITLAVLPGVGHNRLKNTQSED